MNESNWDCSLSVGNAEQVVEGLLKLLVGKRFTIVTATSDGQYIPHVEMNQKLSSHTPAIFSCTSDENKEWVSLSIACNDCTYHISGGKLALFSFKYNQVTIRHDSNSGNHLIWVFVIEKKGRK